MNLNKNKKLEDTKRNSEARNFELLMLVVSLNGGKKHALVFRLQN